MMSSTASSNFWHSLHLLYMSVILLSRDIWFVMSDFMLPLFHFQLFLTDLPVDGHRNMSSSLNTVYPSFLYITGHCFPIFSWRNPLILLLYVESLPFLCHCSHLIHLILLQIFCPFNCLIHIWLIAFVAYNNTYKLAFWIFCVQIFCSIYYLWFIYHFNL